MVRCSVSRVEGRVESGGTQAGDTRHMQAQSRACKRAPSPKPSAAQGRLHGAAGGGDDLAATAVDGIRVHDHIADLQAG